MRFRIQVNFARSRYRPPAGGPAGDGPSARVQEPRSCLLCKSNLGRPGKEALRIYEFPLGGGGPPFFLQLTPFPLFTHHFVLILSEHRPQCIDRRTVGDMIEFQNQAPGYTVCSNSDVQWAGSSILEHLHYQVFRDLHLPVMDARALPGCVARLEGCGIEALDYPMSAFRLSSREEGPVRELGSRLVELWKGRNPGRNTVNLVLFRAGQGDGGQASVGEYRLILLLRNPDYRTPPELRRFKSEGVGVIEASGEAILPVPEGEEAEELWRRIRTEGLTIVKGILHGNSPGLGTEAMAGLIEALGARLS